MTKAKPKAKPNPPAKAAAKPTEAAKVDYVGLTGLVANLIVLGLFAWPMLDRKRIDPTPDTPFATFEQRIKAEVWGEAAAKIRRKEFKDARAAHAWLQAKWPEVEADSFLPVDAMEQEAGQDLDKLATVWEGLSK
jgi:hypothetical protein